MRTLLKRGNLNKGTGDKSAEHHPVLEAQPRRRRRLAPLWRALIEIGFILFLFYSNLLMGEFTRSHTPRTLFAAIGDTFTLVTMDIGVICAFIGYVIVEFLRRKI
jgi:hypothetical protein